MAELRSSIFRSMFLPIRKEIADITENERYNNKALMEEIKRALGSLPNISGMSSSVRINFSFKPIDTDASSIDKSIYENEDNITTNYHLVQTDNAATGTIETKAWVVPDMQVALVTIYWNTTGATGPATIDVSLDKDPDAGTLMTGSWLVADSRIAAIQDGVEFDVSDIPSPSFALQWNFPIGSDYKVLDTTVEILLINSSKIISNRDSIILTTAGNIFASEAMVAGRNGAAEYAEFLNEQAKMKYDLVRGKVGGASTGSLGVQQMGTNFDRTTRANRAFNQAIQDGDWVEVVGTTVSGVRRIRRILT